MTFDRSRRRFCAVLGAAILSRAGVALAATHTRLSVHAAPRPLPEIQFKDKDGKELRLTGFKGRAVLLNVWATWCVPCRREMPTLDRLQAKLGGEDFEVVALSIDRAGVPAVEEFFKEVQIKHLRLYIDRDSNVTRKLAIVGIPTTLLVDREGREVWRKTGEAEWDSDEWVWEIRKTIDARSR